MGKWTNQHFLKPTRTRFMNNMESHIRNNLYEFYHRIATVCGLQSQKTEGWSMVQNRSGFWPNLFYGIGSEFSKVQNQELFTEKINSKPSPDLLIAGNENIQQTDVILQQQGFFPITVWKGMALEKREITFESKLLEQVNISKPITDDELDQWINIVNEELLSTEKLDREQLKIILSQPDFDAWQLKFKEEIVSTILVFRSENASGLYFIATRKSAQRQGFASLLIRNVCLQETVSSEKPLVLHATRDGEAVYSRLGFKSFKPFYLYWKLKKQA